MGAHLVYRFYVPRVMNPKVFLLLVCSLVIFLPGTAIAEYVLIGNMSPSSLDLDYNDGGSLSSSYDSSNSTGKMTYGAADGIGGGGGVYTGNRATDKTLKYTCSKLNADAGTIALWVKQASWDENWDTYFECYGLQLYTQDAGNGHYSLKFTRYTTTVEATDIDNGSIDENQWHHIAVTWDKTAQKIRIFFDGQLKATATWTGTGGVGSDIRVGSTGAGTGQPDAYIDGLMINDKVIYTQDFDPLQEYETEFHYANGLTGATRNASWLQGTYDGGGTGLMTQTATGNGGKFGDGLYTGTRVQDKITKYSYMNLNRNKGTIELWVKQSNWNENWDTYFEASYARIYTQQEWDGHYSLKFIRGSTVVTAYNIENATVSTSDWHHIACTWDDVAQKICIYFDGEKKGETTWAGYPIGTTAYIGSAAGGDCQPDAYIDEVKLSWRAKTSADFLVVSPKVLFLAKYNGSLDADYAVGSKTASGTMNLASATSSGKSGSGLDTGSTTSDLSLNYWRDGNFNDAEGTVEFWAKTSHWNDGTWRRFFTLYNFDIHKNSSNKLSFAGLNHSLSYSLPAVDANVFHHIAVSWNSSGAKLFFDGSLVASDAVATSGSTSGTYMYIGSLNDGSCQVDGIIDELRISDKQIYTSSFTPGVRPVYTLFAARYDSGVNAIYARGLEVPTGNMTITSGNSGKIGEGLATGSTTLAKTLSYERLSNFNVTRGTVEFWVKMSHWNDGSWRRFFTLYNFDIHKNSSNNLSFVGLGHTLSYSLPAVDAGVFHHIAVTWDTVGAKLFFDGSLVASDSVTSNILTQDRFYVGSLIDGTCQVDGIIDELRISDRPIYTSSFTPYSDRTILGATYDSFTDPDFAIGQRYSNYDAVNSTGKMTLTDAGRFGDGLSTGTSQQARTLTYAQSGNIDPVKGTFELWVKMNHWNDGSWRRFVTLTNFDLHKNSSNYLCFAGLNHSLSYALPTVDPSRYHHIAVTWDKSGARLYFDGIKVASASNSPTTTIGSTVYIGSYADATCQVDGTIDEVRIWDHPIYTDDTYTLSKSETADVTSVLNTSTRNIALLNGEPFFPIGIWGFDANYAGWNIIDRPGVLREVADAGFNMIDIQGVRNDEYMDSDIYYLDRVNKEGLKTIVYVSPTGNRHYMNLYSEEDKAQLIYSINALKNHSTVFSWLSMDEPTPWGNAEGLVSGYNVVKSVDANHFVYSNQHPIPSLSTPYDYSRYALFGDVADAFSVDVYPVNAGGHDSNQTLFPHYGSIAVVGDYVDQLRPRLVESGTQTRPMFWILQGVFDPNDPNFPDSAEPTWAQVRFMTYDAIIHGATGIFFWGAANRDWDSGIWSHQKKAAKELSTLKDVYLWANGTATVTVNNLNIEYLLKQDGSNQYLITANRSGSAQNNVQISVQGLVSSSITVCFENRTLQPSGGSFTDNFEAYGVHIYQLAGPMLANAVLVAERTPEEWKQLADSESGKLVDIEVTIDVGDSFFVETDDRSTGIRVAKSGTETYSPGTRATVTGTIETNSNGERYIASTDIATAPGSATIRPLGLSNVTLGGLDWNYFAITGAGQVGVTGGSGLNNVGLLVRAWGRPVLTGSTDSFKLDDGSGADVTVQLPPGQIHGWTAEILPDYVSVTGASGLKHWAGIFTSALYISSMADVTVY